MTDTNLSAFIWSVADLLRGDYKQSEYGKVILPFTVLRRLDCVLEPTKAAVLAELVTRKKAGLNPEPFLLKKSGQLFFNTSPLDLKKLMGDQDHIGENLRAYMHKFSPAVRDIFESFEFHIQIDRLEKADLLNRIPSGLVLTGGASALAGIGELAEEIFESPVRQGLPSSIGGLQDVVRSPMYSTGVGLVLFGLSQQRSAQVSPFRIRDNSIFGRVKERMQQWFFAEFD